jgi:hypothetical protein
MPDEPKSNFERFIAPLLASRFIVISAIVHLILILLIGGRVLFSKYVEPADFQSTGDSTVAADIAPPPPAPDVTLPPTATQPESAAPPPPAAPSMMALATLNPSATSFSVPMPAIPPPTIGKEFNAQTSTTFSNSTAVSLPSAMSGRPGGNGTGIGAKYGEKPPAEQAVLRALRWLQGQQHSDGTWSGGQFSDAFTGLALLCYLGHGETPSGSREFGGVVNLAINALVAQGSSKNGMLINYRDFDQNNDSAYEHAICTYALCEAYTMTKDPKIEPVIKQAVEYIVKAQRDDGGWTYKYDTGPNQAGHPYKSDTSVSGWQIQALKAAHLTGIDGMDQEVRPILDNAMKNIDRVFNAKDGSYGYRIPNDSYNKAGTRTHWLTGVGVLSKLFWLGRIDRDTRAALKDIESHDLHYNDADCNLYAWYYDTQACFQAQGSAWDWWNSRFQDLLISQQAADGSWPPAGQGGAGDYQYQADGDGPLYRTTLCCLMLEVFYRYLPSTTEGGMQNQQVEGL